MKFWQSLFLTEADGRTLRSLLDREHEIFVQDLPDNPRRDLRILLEEAGF